MEVGSRGFFALQDVGGRYWIGWIKSVCLLDLVWIHDKFGGGTSAHEAFGRNH